MRRYETIFITPPELPEEDLAILQEKLRSIITGLQGDLIKVEDWGLKKLGYEIRKNPRGRYLLLNYLAGSAVVRELERNLRLSDRVLKFQTVRLSDNLSPEAIQALKEPPAAEKPKEIIVPPMVPETQAPEVAPKAEPAEGGETK